MIVLHISLSLCLCHEKTKTKNAIVKNHSLSLSILNHPLYLFFVRCSYTKSFVSRDLCFCSDNGIVWVEVILVGLGGSVNGGDEKYPIEAIYVSWTCGFLLFRFFLDLVLDDGD